MTWLASSAACAGAYALGCFVSAFYLVRLRTGSDLRELGSGTTGARNASRVLGKKWGVVAAVADILKGALAVLLVRALGFDRDVELAAAIGVVLGHVWPAQLGFRGGKGVAPAAGALCALDPRLALITTAVGLVAGPCLSDSKRAGLIAVASAPLVASFVALDLCSLEAAFALTLVLLWTHRRDWVVVDRTTISLTASAKPPSAHPPCDD